MNVLTPRVARVRGEQTDVRTHTRACPNLGVHLTSQGKTFCLEHIGERRCQQPGCSRLARSMTAYCVSHGDGAQCTHPLCTRNAAGSAPFCATHGGRRQCQQVRVRTLRFWGRVYSPLIRVC